MDQTQLDFSCKLMRVSRDRGWMNPLVLSSTAGAGPGTPLAGTQYSRAATLPAPRRRPAR